MLAAVQENEDDREAGAALAELCQIYWAPLYTFVRGRGFGPHDAQDLTQGFFAHMIDHRIYERVSPEKGKFRSFLLASMKNFLANTSQRDQALKRGGAQAPLPLLENVAQEAEGFFRSESAAPDPAVDADRLFERNWAQTLVDAAMAQVSQAYSAEGKSTLFEVLRPFIAGENAENLPTHDQMASRPWGCPPRRSAATSPGCVDVTATLCVPRCAARSSPRQKCGRNWRPCSVRSLATEAEKFRVGWPSPLC